MQYPTEENDMQGGAMTCIAIRKHAEHNRALTSIAVCSDKTQCVIMEL